MAHLIDTMAYTGQTPWHGLGNILPPQQSLDIWLQAAGMDWTIEQSDVMFNRHSAPDLGINLPIALTQYLQNDLLVSC